MKNYESCIEKLEKEKNIALGRIEKACKEEEKRKLASLDLLKNFEGAKDCIEDLHEKGYEGWMDLEEVENHFNESNDYFRMQFFHLNNYVNQMRIIPIEVETGMFMPTDDYIPHLTF